MLGLGTLAACGDDGSPVVDASGTGSTSSTSTTTTVASGTGSAAPPVSIPAGGERAYLTGVRVDTKDDGGARVVFEFDPTLPGYTVDFTTRPVTMDGSGEVVAVAGDGVLNVRMENASQARVEGEKVVETYTGPSRVKPAGSGAVTEAVEAGDFEGIVNWVVGLSRKEPKVTISTLSGPSRLVLDVAPA